MLRIHPLLPSCSLGSPEARQTVPMQVVHKFVGYATVWWAVGVYRMLVLLTGGLLWILAQYYVRATLWTLQKRPLSSADFVLVQASECQLSCCMEDELLSGRNSGMLCPVQQQTARAGESLQAHPSPSPWVKITCSAGWPLFQTMRIHSSCLHHTSSVWGSISSECIERHAV